MIHKFLARNLLNNKLFFGSRRKLKLAPVSFSAIVSTCQLNQLRRNKIITFSVFAIGSQKYISKQTALCEKDETSHELQTSYDDEEEKSCPFCRFFLESPCRDSFKLWHRCIKVSDKPTDCMKEFHPLKECMDENGISMGDEEDEDNISETESSETKSM
ncbi:predicted protein [Chaetoceros tenuissimus]|uniref:GCK domain-containing protein n=1 Tax=Chaetoceros tenuissimus TaxID=426638 RepID=A0AAD3D4C4_9STRA|nr:predicted protein [Chaetoceros tenuissimus]